MSNHPRRPGSGGGDSGAPAAKPAKTPPQPADRLAIAAEPMRLPGSSSATAAAATAACLMRSRSVAAASREDTRCGAAAASSLQGCTQLLADMMCDSLGNGNEGHGEEESDNNNKLLDQSTISARSAASTYSLPSFKQMNSSGRAHPRHHHHHQQQQQQQLHHQFSQTLRPQPSAGTAAPATIQYHHQQHHQSHQQPPQPPDSLAASLPIMPSTAAQRPVRDGQHHRLCRHGNPVKKPAAQTQQLSPPAAAAPAAAAPVGPAQCSGACQPAQELRARLTSAEAALERSRAQAEARLGELCARETELIRLRHEALRREARLRADSEREAQVRAAAEARALAAEAEGRRLAAALAGRETELRACQEKMRRINRSLSYVARASGSELRSTSSNPSPSPNPRCRNADDPPTKMKLPSHQQHQQLVEDRNSSGDDTATEDTDTTDRTDVSMCGDASCLTTTSACSCAAAAPDTTEQQQQRPPPLLPTPPLTSPPPQAPTSQRRREVVQPSPPTLDIVKKPLLLPPPPPLPQPQSPMSASTVASVCRRPDDVGIGDDESGVLGGDRDFRLGLARIEDQIRRLQASLKSPASVVI